MKVFKKLKRVFKLAFMDSSTLDEYESKYEICKALERIHSELTQKFYSEELSFTIKPIQTDDEECYEIQVIYDYEESDPVCIILINDYDMSMSHRVDDAIKRCIYKINEWSTSNQFNKKLSGLLEVLERDYPEVLADLTLRDVVPEKPAKVYVIKRDD